MTAVSKIDTSRVTGHQMNLCTRIEDTRTGLAHYKVESEQNFAADGRRIDDKEYEVRAKRINNVWYILCTCKAGKNGVACKHGRWH
jgi:hypothetical protein